MCDLICTLKKRKKEKRRRGMNSRTFSTKNNKKIILAGEDKATTTTTIRKGGIKRLLPERAANQQSLYHECRILTTRPHRVHSYLYTSALKLNNQNKAKPKRYSFCACVSAAVCMTSGYLPRLSSTHRSSWKKKMARMKRV